MVGRSLGGRTSWKPWLPGSREGASKGAGRRGVLQGTVGEQVDSEDAARAQMSTCPAPTAPCGQVMPLRAALVASLLPQCPPEGPA